MKKNLLIRLTYCTLLIFMPFLANANVCLENTNSFGLSFIAQTKDGHITELKPGERTSIKYKNGMAFSLFKVDFGSWIYVADLSPVEDRDLFKFWSIFGSVNWERIPHSCLW